MSLQQGNVYGVLPRTSARSVSIVLMLLHQIVSGLTRVTMALHLCLLPMCCFTFLAASLMLPVILAAIALLMLLHHLSPMVLLQVAFCLYSTPLYYM